MEKYFVYIQLLGILLFAACNSEIEEAKVDEIFAQYTATLRLDCSIDSYDANTRAASDADTASWNNGDAIYIQFSVGESRVAGKATYQAANNTWTVTYNGTLHQGAVATCQLYYFKDPKSTTSTSVNLTPQSAIYVDNQAQYVFDHGIILIKGRLKPLVGRVRFKGPSRRVIRLSGLNYYNSFNVASGTLSQSNSMPSIEVGSDGYTPYVYAKFMDPAERTLQINYGGLSFSKQFGSGVLAEGKSGFIDIPLIDSFDGWALSEQSLGGLDYSTLEYNTAMSLDYTYTDSYQPEVESWHWIDSLSSLYNDIYNMYYVSANDWIENYDAILRYYCGGKYTNEDRIDGVLKQYIVRGSVNGYIFTECSPDNYLGTIRINDGCLKWDVEGEKLKQFALDGNREATRAIRYATYSYGLMDIFVILKAGPINVTKEESADPLGLCPDANHPHAIDLGIGVKFSCCNVGADSPTGYGNYYAWGETSTKSQYDWSTYKWCNGTYNTMTKYCTDSKFGTVDNITTLELSDDAARANWGSPWRMPTYDELNKLNTQCTWTWVTVDGINGYRVTAANGNSIFLPTAGCRYDAGLDPVGSNGYFWSSSLLSSSSDGALGLDFHSGDHGLDSSSRYDGRSVRPVYAENEEAPLDLCPDNNHPHAIDLGIGVKFACCNVGADSPTDNGNYYAWGETTTKNKFELSTYKWCRGSLDSMTKYCTNSSFGTYDNKTTLELTDDAAHGNWGGSWRMPTYAELNKLIKQCTWNWVTVCGVNGYRVTASNGNSIFLPAEGFCIGTTISRVGSGGSYWSSSLYYSTDAYYLNFHSSDYVMQNHYRYNGRSVRPVTE